MTTSEEIVMLANQLLDLNIITQRQRREVDRRVDEPDFLRQFKDGALLLGGARQGVMERLLGPRGAEQETEIDVAEARITHPVAATHASASSNSPLVTVGYLVASVGFLLGFVAFGKSTTVSSGYGLSQTHNIGLIADREVMMIAAAALLVSGFLLSLIGSVNDLKNAPR